MKVKFQFPQIPPLEKENRERKAYHPLSPFPDKSKSCLSRKSEIKWGFIELARGEKEAQDFYQGFSLTKVSFYQDGHLAKITHCQEQDRWRGREVWWWLSSSQLVTSASDELLFTAESVLGLFYFVRRFQQFHRSKKNQSEDPLLSSIARQSQDFALPVMMRRELG